MKKTLIGIGIVTSMILTGCTSENDINLGPKSVADMMDNQNIVGWENYKDDKDKDGVPDYKDKCPNTPEGAQVDKNGCALDDDKDGVINLFDRCPKTPIGVKVDKNGCALDDDKDGIANYLDKCPNTPRGMVVDEHGCVVDNDRDGVPDYKDRCPNTPEGAQVDEYGCAIDSDRDGVIDLFDRCPNTPEGAEVDMNGCALDDDKDSVINLFDKCPNTPKGVVVGVDGCPIDTDKDGVPDYKDKCPNTPAGIQVNFQGCPVLAEYRFNFKFNSYKIDKKYYPQIEKLVKILKNNPKINIDIQGYTDNIGKKSYNKKLSLKRANALKQILVNKFKISPKRITIIGYGSEYPIADNSTKEGQAKNRRIVVIDTTNFKLDK